MKNLNLIRLSFALRVFAAAFLPVWSAGLAAAQPPGKIVESGEKQRAVISSIEQTRVYFRTRSGEVSPDSRQSLQKIVELFKQLPPQARLEIGGHTDDTENIGKTESGYLKLSEMRSEAVRTELVTLGLDAGRISVQGYGRTRPTPAGNTGALARAKNRRAEFKINFSASGGGNISTPEAKDSSPETKPVGTSPTETPGAKIEPCPSISVLSPDAVEPGKTITFTADVFGGDPKVTPTYTWYISAGKIIAGDGTSSITVETKGLADGSSVTATVDVGGFDRSCSFSNAGTTTVKKN